jgi:hypothetical protein
MSNKAKGGTNREASALIPTSSDTTPRMRDPITNAARDDWREARQWVDGWVGSIGAVGGMNDNDFRQLYPKQHESVPSPTDSSSTRGNCYSALNPDAEIIVEDVDQHLEFLLEKHWVSATHLISLVRADQPDILQRLLEFRHTYHPQIYWEHIPLGRSSLFFVKAFRRGPFTAPSYLLERHLQFLLSEFEKVSNHVGSWAAAFELSKYAQNTTLIGIKEEDGRLVSLCYRNGQICQE